MTVREWLNVLAVMESIEEVPGLAKFQNRHFRLNPVEYLRKSSDGIRSLIWREVERRLGGGA